MLTPPPNKTEFSYKNKPKLDAQFKSAEAGGVPFAVILGEEEQAQGKVKIKEMGLEDGQPEKAGVMVELKDLVEEVRVRLRRKDTNAEEKVNEGIKRLSIQETDRPIGVATEGV